MGYINRQFVRDAVDRIIAELEGQTVDVFYFNGLVVVKNAANDMIWQF
jgi:hypothetical protein